MPSKHINLLQRYIVKLITTVPSFINTFGEHGGFDDKLFDRIMNAFTVVETAHLQQPLNKAAKIENQIGALILNDKGGDLIDLWKEICNTKPEKTQMSLGILIYRTLRETKGPNGEALGHFFFPDVKERYTGYMSVDNMYTALTLIYKEMLNSNNREDYARNMGNVLEMLASYPYIQKQFLEDNFDMVTQSRLSIFNSPYQRGQEFISLCNAVFDKKMAGPAPTPELPKVDMEETPAVEEAVGKTPETKQLKEELSPESKLAADRFAHLVKKLGVKLGVNPFKGLEEEFALPDSVLEQRQKVREQYLKDVLAGRACICGQCGTEKEEEQSPQLSCNDKNLLGKSLLGHAINLSDALKDTYAYLNLQPSFTIPTRRSDSQRAYVNIRRFELPTPKKPVSEIKHTAVYTFEVPGENHFSGEDVYRLSYRNGNAVFEVAQSIPGRTQQFQLIMDPIATTEETALRIFEMIRNQHLTN